MQKRSQCRKSLPPSLTETKTCLFQLQRLIENMNEDSLAQSFTHLNDPVDHL